MKAWRARSLICAPGIDLFSSAARPILRSTLQNQITQFAPDLQARVQIAAKVDPRPKSRFCRLRRFSFHRVEGIRKESADDPRYGAGVAAMRGWVARMTRLREQSCDGCVELIRTRSPVCEFGIPARNGPIVVGNAGQRVCTGGKRWIFIQIILEYPL